MKPSKLLSASAAIAASAVMATSGASATECVELDYVEATGAQWVDTGIIGRCGTKAEIKVEWTDLESDSAMLACRADSGNTRINFINSNWGAIGYGYGAYYAGTYNGRNCRWEKDRIYTVVTDFAASGDGATAVMTVDGYKVGDQSSESQIDTEVNLVVFGNNYGSVTGLSKARCYGLKIWQDGSLVRDFVPVAVDGRAGFRDAVSGNFFYSASGTDLIAGTLASDPDCFVEYVESSGSEYIDLEVTGKSGVKMESRMMWVAIPSDGSYVASRLGSSPRFYLMHHYGSQTIGYGGYYQSGAVATAGTIYDTVTELKAGAQTCVVNGETIYSASDSASIDTGLNLYLFGCNKDGGATYQTKARCYSLRLWEGENLVRDFRPCLKNGEACLYDQVSHRIFRTKAGTLKYGAITPKAPTSGKPDYFVTYIESMGNNYLDTGVRAKNNLRIVGDLNYTQIRTQAEELYVYLTGLSEHTLLGACASDGGNRCYAVHVNQTWLWYGYGTRRGYPGPSEGYFPTTARHLYDVTMANGTQSINVDGEDIAMNFESVAAYDIDAGCNLYLFACNKGGTVQYPARARCYSLTIWQDGVPVRDLRPCVKDGVAGFYDSVNDEIIYTAYPVAPSCVGEMDLTGESFESIKGGRKSVDGDYEVHTFTSSGTLTVEGREAVDILVVGGGGGGGSRNTSGGGGGGGGVIYKQSFAVTSGVYQVVVGVGGGGGDSARGENGGNSSIFGLVAKGGGGGGGNYPSGTTDYNGQSGGSGGGGSGAGGGGSNNPGDGTSGQGNAGGKGYKWRGGGGGGYAAAGGDSVAEGQAGAGGVGFECLITGKAVCYGSGGGGGSTATTGNGLGGDGAGNGGVYNGSVGEAGGNGVDGTGGGGGGGGGNSANANGYGEGGNGGRGVVIIRCRHIPFGTRIIVR